MLTLAEFAEHTSSLRKSSTLPHRKVIKTQPLTASPDLQFEDVFGTSSSAAPTLEKYEEKPPEPVSEMMERWKGGFMKHSMGLVPEARGTFAEERWFEDDKKRIYASEESDDEDAVGK